MASIENFARYVAEQFELVGEIRLRKMFGEYALYCDGLYFTAACDNQLFVKITPGGRALAADAPEVPPYEGAKPCLLVEDLNDREFLCRLAQITCAQLPPPRPRKKRAP